MKLYTAQDFLKAAEFCEVSMIDAKYIIERIDEVATPIKLPSDEEIERIASDYKSTSEFSDIENFEDGSVFAIKWMRNKIQGGNK